MSSASENQQKHQPAQQAVAGMNRKKKWYLLLSNPSKTTHLGTLLRCAAAFQCHQVLLVGYDKFNCQGSFGSHLFLDIVVFPSWNSVRDYLRRGGDESDDNGTDAEGSNDGKSAQTTADISEARGTSTTETHANEQSKRDPVPIVGILGAYGGGEEIFSSDGMPVYEDADSYASIVPPEDSANTNNPQHEQDATTSCLPYHSLPIHIRPFSTDVCFMLSKDKKGLPSSQARMCSGFVHVPHLSFGNSTTTERVPNDGSIQTQTAMDTSPITQSSLLDTATTLSTVLHHFTAWAGYAERTFAENQKFVKDVKPNSRRRLCRIAGRNHSKTDEIPESDSEVQAMDAMMLFKEADVADY